MCFSASISFGASALLGAAGGVAIKKAKTIPMKVFALTPLLFGIQQFSEGIVWMSLNNPGSEFSEFWLSKSVYTFLFFAWVIWPIFIPAFTILLEKNQERKKILKGLLVNGVIVSTILVYVVFSYSVEAETSSYHIQYIHGVDYPYLWVFGLFI